MNLQQIMDNAVAAKRAEEFKISPQLSLGELILKLEAITDQSKTVGFEFEHLRPTGFDSYRGYYSDLAIGFASGDDAPEVRVDQFLTCAKECMGKTFTGYKGGDYVMGKTTPIWIANCGNSGGTGLVDVIETPYSVKLRVSQIDE